MREKTNANFHFSHYKSMETISCHNNQSPYPIGTKIKQQQTKKKKKKKKKTIFFVPPIYRCYVWNMAESASWLQSICRLKMLTTDCYIFTLADDFPLMNHFTGFIYRWPLNDRATLSLSDVTDKQTPWLVNFTFDWRQVMKTTIQRDGRTLCSITFLRRIFCTINIESSQLIHRNDLKIRCKYKS